jgi:flavodoxin I
MNIIYASTSGNVEAVCEYVAKLFEEKGSKVNLIKAQLATIEDIKSCDVVIFATSTWEHGEVNPYFDKLLSEIEKTDMTGLKAGFVGLGDLRYEKLLFCEGIEILRRAFVERKGEQISTTLKMNGEPYHQMDTIVKNWTSMFISKLNMN